jgi:predicted small secreted protein
MKTIIQNVIIGFLACLLMVAVTGCKNTAHGAGEDIEKMGEKIQEKTD